MLGLAAAPALPADHVAARSTGGDDVAELTEKQRDAIRRLGELLDSIDEQTRREGEPPLRQVVAEHAREQLRDRKGDDDDD